MRNIKAIKKEIIIVIIIINNVIIINYNWTIVISQDIEYQNEKVSVWKMMVNRWITLRDKIQKGVKLRW